MATVIFPTIASNVSRLSTRIFTMRVRICSLNVNGLRTFHGTVPKRRKIYTWIKKKKVDIIFIQETHSDPLGESGENWAIIRKSTLKIRQK